MWKWGNTTRVIGGWIRDKFRVDDIAGFCLIALAIWLVLIWGYELIRN